MKSNVLNVTDLTVELRLAAADVPVVTGVSFEVQRGETLGLVGESGCGKTMTSLAVMGVLPRVARVAGGSIKVDGRELVGAGQRELEDVRGRRIGMVFQDAMRCLDPSFTVGQQLIEVARRHLGISRRAAADRAAAVLNLVGIKQPRSRLDDYPHQFSGGMAQRVMIALAIICEPVVLIADEPTTALDVTIQRQVLRLLHDLQQELGLAVLLITHDLGVVAQVCDRVAVMYAGQIVEQASSVELFDHARHPYTEALVNSIPRADRASRRLRTISGTVPPPMEWSPGCRFAPRCTWFVPDRCDEPGTSLIDVVDGHACRCVRAPELVLRGNHGQ
ncbi:ABC transporter ATP-binding protein [Nocardia pseudovaccinii]|uniref:ABC transporter ATP-binding protein n=1 Tax=Nocardia pseudovaccinii TaxID=189540 RepID=UPI0007A440A2|nr:ABC transporter ATP-binding protein [Nocardia pseudovaccinii]